MKAFVPAVIFIGVLCSLESGGQTKGLYFQKTFDFSDTINSKLAKNLTENVATILVDGYLQGKLRGYGFNVGSEVLKRGPIPIEDYIPWEPGMDYFAGDRVTYQGKFYEALTDFRAKTSPADSKDLWTPLNIEGSPVSTRFYFPTIKDTVSKKDFLEGMISRMPMHFEPWDPARTYLAGDVVDYRGKSYEAIADSEGKVPSGDMSNWQLTSMGGVEFFKSRDFVGMEILYFTDARKQLIPQTISPLVEDWNLGLRRPTRLHFLFDEAIGYLNLIDEPLVYSSDLGYIEAPEFVLTEERRTALLTFLKARLRSKEIKLKKGEILDAQLYKDFLSDTAQIQTSSRWKVFQTLSNEFVVTDLRQTEVDYETVPLIRIPGPAVSKLAQKPSVMKTYRDLLLNGGLNFRLDSAGYDSLPPRTNTTVPLKPGAGRFFYESLKAKTNSLNANLQQQVSSLWDVVQKAFYAKRISPRWPMVSLYPCDYDWTSTHLEIGGSKWSFYKNFSLGYYSWTNFDTIPVPKSFTEIAVTYKRKVTPHGEKRVAFQPVELLIQYLPAPRGDSDGNNYPVSFTFDWSEIKSLISKNNLPELASFVTRIESGNLVWYDSNLVYGLMEEKAGNAPR